MTNVLPILLEGDARLRQRAAEVEALGADLGHDVARVAATLADFRARNGFGRAIAAPQIGISRRLIAVDLGADPFILINPEIVFRTPETFEVWDDCFSVPDKIVRVLRHRSISLTYRDERFRMRRWEKLPEDLSELLQHEIDHLDGILMVDRAQGENAVRPASERALVDARRPVRRLSPARIREARRTVDPVFLDSPQFLSEPLSDALGLSLVLKVETINPIRSFKGRGSGFFVGSLASRGNVGSLVTASAGNFGQGMAYACRKRGIPLTVFAAKNANPLKVERMRALGADVRLKGGDFDAAKDAAVAFASETRAAMVEDGAPREIAEGAGTIGLELLARGDVFDEVLVPLGNGALLGGVARWIKAASPATRVLGVVSRGAPIMAEVLGRCAPIAPPAAVETIADGIAVRVPVPEAVKDLEGLVDDVLRVDDSSLVDAMRLVHRHAGLVVEPAGVAGLAAILEAREIFRGRSVATVLCGGNVTPDQQREWLS